MSSSNSGRGCRRGSGRRADRKGGFFCDSGDYPRIGMLWEVRNGAVTLRTYRCRLHSGEIGVRYTLGVRNCSGKLFLTWFTPEEFVDVVGLFGSLKSGVGELGGTELER